MTMKDSFDKLKTVAGVWMRKSTRGNKNYLKGKVFLDEGETLVLRNADGSEKTVNEFLGFESQSQKTTEKSKWYLKVTFAEDEESKDSE